jgi:hypothetical protein
VIDYDEAFDPTATPSTEVQALPPTAPRELANGTNGVHSVEEGKDTMSPKRSREEGGVEENEAGKDANEAGGALLSSFLPLPFRLQLLTLPPLFCRS